MLNNYFSFLYNVLISVLIIVIILAMVNIIWQYNVYGSNFQNMVIFIYNNT